MATERLPMRHIREILRLKWTLHRSHRETARSLGISAGAVASVVSRATALLYGPRLALTVARPGPDLVGMHTELRRKGVTLELLHLEYLAAHPDGYRFRPGMIVVRNTWANAAYAMAVTPCARPRRTGRGTNSPRVSFTVVRSDA